MKKLCSNIAAMALLCATALTAQAQVADLTTSASASTSGRVSMCDHLTAGGHVTIHQDARLEALLTPASDRGTSTSGQRSDKSNRIVTTGYRIRIFSGNNQTASKSRANEISNEIKRKFPDLELYVYFKTPNWRLTAGNFRTSEEAYAMMAELKKEFATLGREMFIVRDEIELLLD